MSNELDVIAQNLSDKTGISFIATSGRKDGYFYTNIRPASLLVSPIGFTIHIQTYWKRFEISFIPDNFARSLIEYMGHTNNGKKVYLALANSLIKDSAKLYMQINGNFVDPLHPEDWQSEWNSLNMTMEKFCDEDLRSTSNLIEILSFWSYRFLNMLIPLLPLEESTDYSFSDTIGLPEGAVTQVMVNKYERNPVNRAACIAIMGCYCHICNTNFEKIYGKLGEDFIEVHHITPISQLGKNYIIDPAKDLIPVCPNCHAMLHRRNPPLSIDELKAIYLTTNR